MNDTSQDSMMESVALYALGVLPREEAALVAAFIANNDEARREYLDLRAAADALALSADEPVDSARSARMKERLMARVRSDAAGGTAALRRRTAASYPAWLWGTGLAAAAAIVFSVVTVAQDVNLRGQLAQAQNTNANLRTQLAQNDRVASQNRRTLTDLVAADAKVYQVTGGRVVVRGDKAYFALSNLPPLAKGKVYQAWTQPKGATKMVPSVTFTPDADGVAVIALPVDARGVGAVALSVEPEGGSKAPTSTPTFVRQLS
ncbi:MAG TPA: anti-sigma factor [Candidatus Elarobacter sp.]|jgi:anti-sigma factor RsiW|nr:anti-sigma factor [Candidatus Elarobacter sp.]